MPVAAEVGDILQFPADALISTANPWLNLSGGVNGAILAAGGESIQAELHQHLKQLGTKGVSAGTVVMTSAGNLPYRHILHAVAIDPFYDSSAELVLSTFTKALTMAKEQGAKTIVSPTLATGYGPLSISQFGEAVSGVLRDERFTQLSIKFVVRRDDAAEQLRSAFGRPV